MPSEALTGHALRLEELLERICRDAGVSWWIRRLGAPGDKDADPTIARHLPGSLAVPDGEAFLELVHPEDRDGLESARHSGGNYSADYRLRNSDGDWRYVREICEDVVDDDDNCIEQICTLRDLSGQRTMEVRVLQREAWLDQAQQLAKLGFWVWHGPEVSNWHPDAEEANRQPLLSRTYRAALGAGDEALSSDWQPHPDDKQRLADTLRRADRERVRYEIAYRIVDAPGAAPQRTIREVGVPSRDPDTDEPIWMGLVQDITEQREAERQLWQVQKMEAVGRLTGGVAHDFNNLLSVIIGNLELAAESISGEREELSLVQQALNAAERGARLTHRLLAFSRKQALAPVPVDIDALVRGMEDLLRRSLAETIEIEIISESDLWPCLVDPSQLENSVLNLAINARDAMPTGGKLTIEAFNTIIQDEYADTEPEVEPGEYVRLSISDNGFGMSRDVLRRVFEPFFTTKDVGQGSGLGLAMVYGFAKQSGGHVTIYSEEGEGTTVRLYIPRSRTGGEAISARTPVVPGKAQGESILLVEDDLDLRRLMHTLLQSLNYRVVDAGSGPEALQVIHRESFIDLLLTDVVLPGGISGRQLAGRVRELSPKTVVLYTSGYSENAVIHHERLDPGVTLLQKPFRKDQLAQMVRHVLDSRPAG